MKKIIVLLISVSMLAIKVNAQSYTTTTDITDNTYTNALIGMADNDKVLYKNEYIIFRSNEDYYMVVGDLNINNSTVSGNNTKVYKAIRTQQGNFNYIYNYSKADETNTSVNINNLVLTDINGNSTSRVERIDLIRERENARNFYKFLLGLVFALFLVRSRDSI